MGTRRTIAVVGLLGALLVASGVAVRVFVFPDAQPGGAADGGPIPVELAAIEAGPIERRRDLSGSVEASAQYAVAAKVAGRITAIHVDLGDPVNLGQRLVELDDAELGQAEAAAEADLAVAEAEASAAAKAAKIATRNLDRVEGLRGRDIASDQELDVASAAEAEAAGALEVARAQVVRARAAYRAAQIRRGYAEITADWPGAPADAGAGAETRVVGERLVDEGSMVAANAPLLTIVDLDPVVVVVFVTEADYAALRRGLAVVVTTDAYPGERFAGEISRIAPVFREQSRQARIEITVANTDGRLKPGMFVRAAVSLDRLDAATIVPAAALVERDGQVVVFTVAGGVAAMRAVTVGIRDGERVAVTPADAGGPPLTGQVVVLGQQQLVDGSPVVEPELPASVGGGGQG